VAYYDEVIIGARRRIFGGARVCDPQKTSSYSLLLNRSHLLHAKIFAKNVLSLARNGETSALRRVEWTQVKTKKTLAVQWVAGEIEAVPVVSATGLEIRAADRFLEFARTHIPNFARYSVANDLQRGKPTCVL
jgi:hypothetical protein